MRQIPYLRPVNGPEQQLANKRPKPRYKPPPPERLAEMMKAVGSRPDPMPYPPKLAEFAAEYRNTGQLPRVAPDKFRARPNDGFRMFPAKCRAALDYASPDAVLVFNALWSQHERRHGRANGVLECSIDWLHEKTRIGRRSDVSRALIELEVRGLIRMTRGRAGAGKAFCNMALLTAFPDAQGGAPTADYEALGIPDRSPTATDEATLRIERDNIDAEFNRRIRLKIELVRYVRNETRDAG